MFESLIQDLIANTEIVILIAFLLGVLTSISPCPLATNIAAVAYISREIKTPGHAVLNSIFYTSGRIFAYFTVGAGVILLGMNVMDISITLQGIHGEILGIILIVSGLFMLGVINFNFNFGSGRAAEKLSKKFACLGFAGAFLLGVLFALAFCPYSAVLFFGTLIPIGLASREGIILPAFYGFGTGIPVLAFAALTYFGSKEINRHVQNVSRFEKILRKVIVVIFIASGIYLII